jgi:hypothetical protein
MAAAAAVVLTPERLSQSFREIPIQYMSVAAVNIRPQLLPQLVWLAHRALIRGSATLRPQIVWQQVAQVLKILSVMHQVVGLAALRQRVSAQPALRAVLGNQDRHPTAAAAAVAPELTLWVILQPLGQLVGLHQLAVELVVTVGLLLDQNPALLAVRPGAAAAAELQVAVNRAAVTAQRAKCRSHSRLAMTM